MPLLGEEAVSSAGGGTASLGSLPSQQPLTPLAPLSPSLPDPGNLGTGTSSLTLSRGSSQGGKGLNASGKGPWVIPVGVLSGSSGGQEPLGVSGTHPFPGSLLRELQR